MPVGGRVAGKGVGVHNSGGSSDGKYFTDLCPVNIRHVVVLHYLIIIIGYNIIILDIDIGL